MVLQHAHLKGLNGVDNAAQKHFRRGGCLWGRVFVYGDLFIWLPVALAASVCLGVSVEKWKFREVTTVNLGIRIIFVMDFLGSVPQSALIASDERCYKSGKCIKVLFYFKEGFFFLKCRISVLEDIFKIIPLNHMIPVTFSFLLWMHTSFPGIPRYRGENRWWLWDENVSRMHIQTYRNALKSVSDMKTGVFLLWRAGRLE